MYLGKQKKAYLSTFGIAPYFKVLVDRELSRQDGYKMMFSSSLNKLSNSNRWACTFLGVGMVIASGTQAFRMVGKVKYCGKITKSF